MDAIQNIILGVIGSLIAAFIFELWRANSDWFPGPSTPPARFMEPEAKADARTRNRQRLKMAIFNGFFYLYTFFLVYQALSLPPVLRVMISGKPILLSDARILGSLLPDVAITNSTFQLSLLLAALVLYVVLLFVVNFVASLLAPVVDKFWTITIFVWPPSRHAVYTSCCMHCRRVDLAVLPSNTKGSSQQFFLACLQSGHCSLQQGNDEWSNHSLQGRRAIMPRRAPELRRYAPLRNGFA